MVKGELDPRILELLKRKLEGELSPYTIQSAISRTRTKYAFLTLNAAAEVFGNKYGVSVQKYLNDKDRAALGTFGNMRREKTNIAPLKPKRVSKPAKERIPTMEKTNGTWDVFISHASEDKESIARPLKDALIHAGLRVWYDESELKIGDRLHKSIDEGIAKSGFGIVILSENFFKKDWPQRELEGLVAKEIGGRKVILPIWHNVDAAFVRSKSLLLAGLVGVPTSEGIEFIVQKVLEVVKPAGVAPALPRPPIELPKGRESTKSILEGTIHSLQGISYDEILQTIKKMDFNVLKKTYNDLLDAMAIFDITSSSENKNIFTFLREAVLEREQTEGEQLFEILLKWYFETTAPRCKYGILSILANLTRLRNLKEVASKGNWVGEFVAEFGRSDSYDMAGVNSEIIQNIKSLLSSNDCARIVDFALGNSQINESYSAKQYLIKLLPTCQGKVDQKKIDQLYSLLT
jgi:hypothetical protein